MYKTAFKKYIKLYYHNFQLNLEMEMHEETVPIFTRLISHIERNRKKYTDTEKHA